MEKKFTIRGVCVWFGDVSVYLPKLARHSDCFKYAKEKLGIDSRLGSPAYNQGFYSANGTYFTREQAFWIAKKRDRLLIRMKKREFCLAKTFGRKGEYYA